MGLSVVQPLALDTYTRPGILPGNKAHGVQPVNLAFSG